MDDSKILLGNFEMLKALYNFKATFAKTLSFRENDHFILHQTNTKQRNWWQVINEKGEIGFVPSNYVEKVKVNPSYLLQFLDDCIINLENEKPFNAALDRQELILRIKEKRRQTEINIKSISTAQSDNENEFSTNIELPSFSDSLEHVRDTRSSTTYMVSSETEKSVPDLKYGRKNSDIEEEPIKPVHIQSSSVYVKSSLENINQDFVQERKSQANQSAIISKHEITRQDVFDLVEMVRVHTKLSHELSQVAVHTVVSHLQELLPQTAVPHLSQILSLSETSLVSHDTAIDETHDANRLKHIFKELTDCKEDSQQRSWMLYEDEHVIIEYITELISILSNADTNISKHVIAREQYYVVVTLIQYYQMEIRWSIRQLLLQAFGVMCSLDKYIVNVMLNSVLPMELARDMRTNPRNISKLNYSSLLLTMIFSMGDVMPVTHLEQLGCDFIAFILNAIENPPDTDIDDQIPDLFLNFIIAFNLQYMSIHDNIVLKSLSQQTSAKIFTEKILLLLNREEDPVRIFEHEPAPPHSVLKLFNDMFALETTANLFYTNDIKVLIDIVVRQLSDLSAGDKKRQQYLELCRQVMRNTNYAEHQHRHEDIHKCFTRIFCEETEQSKMDQQLVREISNEFPNYFKL